MLYILYIKRCACAACSSGSDAERKWRGLRVWGLLITTQRYMLCKLGVSNSNTQQGQSVKFEKKKSAFR